MEMMVAGTVVWRHAADLDELQAQSLRRSETRALGARLPAPAPFDQRSPEPQERSGVLDHHRGRRQSPGEHDITGPHSLPPPLRASTHHTGVGHLSASKKSFDKRALASLRLDQAELRSRKRHRQRQSRKASTRTKVRGPFRRRNRLHPKGHKRVGEVNINSPGRIAYRGRRSLICRQQEQDLLQLRALTLPQVVALNQVVKLGGGSRGESLGFHVKRRVAGSGQRQIFKHLPAAQALLPQRRDHQIPLRFIALAVGAHVPTLAQVLVHHPSLRCRHRRKLHRLSQSQRFLGGVVGILMQR